MGTYFDEERKKPRWDSGQAILHKESTEKQTKKDPQKDSETYRVKNSYGTLRYLKKDTKKGGRGNSDKDGFAVEAFESPNTPVHTAKEKHLNRRSMKKIRQNDKQALFASETPLRDQALFFDMKGGKKSADLIRYMKELLQRQGHQTLEDTFGFLDQEPEREELEALKSEQKNSLSHAVPAEERQDAASRRIDALNSQLLKKEAKERQLQNELQLMLDRRAREEFLDEHQDRSQKKQEAPQKDKDKNMGDTSPQRRLYSDTEMSETDSEGGADETDSQSESSPQISSF